MDGQNEARLEQLDGTEGIVESGRSGEAGQGEAGKRDRSDIAKSGEFSACPYCQ